MADIPAIDTSTVQELLTLAQERAIAVSGGKLSDRSPGSPVTALLEGMAVVAAQIQNKVNTLAVTIENNRIAIFGITRRDGTSAIGTIEVSQDGLYADPFFLPRGFRVSFDGVQFETDADLEIPPYTESGRTTITALDLGTRGNLPATSDASFQLLTRLASIALVEATQGGQDIEDEDSWKARIYATIRRRDTLISEDDFEAEIKDYLGLGSVSLAIGRLKPDRATYDNGYVACFGLNPDNSQLTNTQIADLQDYLNRKAAMASISVASIEFFPVTVEVVTGVTGGTKSIDAIAQDINRTVGDYLSPGNLQPGQMILNKAIERRIQNLSGISEGLCNVQVNGFAQPQTLPNAWTVAKLTSLAVTLTPGVGRVYEYDYTFDQ